MFEQSKDLIDKISSIYESDQSSAAFVAGKFHTEMYRKSLDIHKTLDHLADTTDFVQKQHDNPEMKPHYDKIMEHLAAAKEHMDKFHDALNEANVANSK